MPRRLRVAKAHYGPLTLDEHLMWTTTPRDQLIADFGSLEAAREAWHRRRPHVRVNPGTSPEACWALDGPPALATLPDVSTARTHEERIAIEEAFDANREAWLQANGGDWRTIAPQSNGRQGAS